MAYTPNIWVDREGTTRYFETVEKDGAKIFTPDYSQLTEIGTPVNADNMNHIEEGIAAGSFTKYDSNTVYQINDLVTSFEGSELKVYKSLKSENYNNPVTNTTYWAEVELGGGGSGFSLFDIVQKDHVLTFEESKGLAMLGSYVYKNGVAGSRYGYADFYEKCLDEYKSIEVTDWAQPTLTENGVLGGDSFAVSGTVNATGDYYVYCAFDNNTSTDWVSASETENLIIYNPSPIKITRIDVVNRNAGTTRYIKSGTIYGSNDNSKYEQIATFTNTVSSQLGEWFIDLSTNTKAYKYYKFSMTGDGYCSANQITITASEVFHKSSNGHIYYDIANKPSADFSFATSGEAMFYGVDEENERIFLPRRTRAQATMNPDEVNGFVEAGLPNITGQFGCNVNSGEDSLKTSGAFTRNAFGSEGSTGDSENSTQWTFDASRCSSIYGNSDTVQPPASLVLEYMVVGNVNVEKAQTDVTEITTSENDTLPLFHNFYSKEDMTTTGAYVNASLGGYLSGNVYTTAYQELVNKLGTGNVKSVTDEYTDEDFVVNQDDMTFRLPLKNGQEIMFATGVRGTGLGLGITTKSGDVYASYRNQDGDFHMAGSTNPEIGSTYTLNGLTGTWGVSTDSSRSNIVVDTENITIPEGWNLYYKVTNALSNLAIMDAAKIETSKADKTAVDGQWVECDITVFSGTIGAQELFTVDLSEILPNDGYAYECLFNAWVRTGKSSGNTVDCQLFSGSKAAVGDFWVRLCRCVTRSSSDAAAAGNGVVVIYPYDRAVSWKNGDGSGTSGSCGLSLNGYRRIGTNQ